MTKQELADFLIQELSDRQLLKLAQKIDGFRYMVQNGTIQDKTGLETLNMVLDEIQETMVNKNLFKRIGE